MIMNRAGFDGRKILIQEAPLPPTACQIAVGGCGEYVIVASGSEVFGRPIRKGIVFQEREDRRRALEQPTAEGEKPRTPADVISERSEPHLPVEAWLVRSDEGGAS